MCGQGLNKSFLRPGLASSRMADPMGHGLVEIFKYGANLKPIGGWTDKFEFKFAEALPDSIPTNFLIKNHGLQIDWTLPMNSFESK